MRTQVEMSSVAQAVLAGALKLSASRSRLLAHVGRRLVPWATGYIVEQLRFAPPSRPRAEVPATPAPSAPKNADLPRFNVFGFFGGRFGLGEAARLYATALEAVGVDVRRVDLDADVVHERFPQEALRSPPFLGANTVDLVVVNPDVLGSVIGQIERTGARRPRIGSWFWELADAPPQWAASLAHVDSLVAASSHVQRALSRLGRRPVHVVPLPVVQFGTAPAFTRAELGLPEATYIFLAALDFHSSFDRKNPLAVIRAFKQAFADTTDRVALVIKTSNACHYPHALKRLLDEVGGDSRIVIRDALMDGHQISALQRNCDAFVSLHRAEGYGLSMAECMSFGKPVIATGWSGNLEYMDASTALLIESRLVGVAENCPPYTGGHWAEPDIAQAASAMRLLATDREFAQQLGQRGRDRVLQQLAPDVIGLRMLAVANAVFAQSRVSS